MSSISRIATCLAGLVASLVTALPASAELTLSPCRIDAGSALDTARARCGTFTVPENPDAPEGRTIDLYVALIPALSVEPQPDPLVILAGGPGQSAVDAYLSMRGAFEPIRQFRPILLVDQRGTGRSNILTCPLDMAESFEDIDLERNLELTRECLGELPGEPGFYTTSVAVRDLDAVRAALGFEQLNLWGGSYGTRVALHYLRRYPEHARTVILDGVVPAEEMLGPEIAVDAQASLDFMFARCAEDPDCQETYGDLGSRFDALLAELRTTPAEVSVRHPRTGELTEFPLSGDALAGIIRLSIYSPATRAMLPLMIDRAADGDFQAIGGLSLMVAEQFDGMMATGMHNSVVCSEDMPFYDPADRPDGIDETFLGPLQLDFLVEICKLWPTGPVDDDFHEPVQSDQPVLLLSGEYDPVTPPENAELTARSLGNARHIVAPRQGHIVTGLGCVPKLLAEFVASADPGKPDAECVDRLGAMPFFVSPLGPTP